jgi:hypothetical protein
MVFCGDTLGQGHFYGDQHSLFIVMQNQRQDIDHFPITARLAQHEILLLFECRGNSAKGAPFLSAPGLR